MVKIILWAVNRLVIQSTFVANQSLFLSQASHLAFVQVPFGPGVVEQYIVERAQSGDLVIPQDIPLAALLLFEEGVVISHMIPLFSDSNIGESLVNRNLMTDFRDFGLMTVSPNPFGLKKKNKSLCECVCLGVDSTFKVRYLKALNDRYTFQ